MASPSAGVRIPDRFTRQQSRNLKRQEAFRAITMKFGGELRKVRRAMAFALAKRKA